MIIIFLIFSFLLEGIIYSLIDQNSIIIPLFSLLSLVLLYPYFNNKKSNFIITALILGFFYDIVYTNTLFINVFTFGLLALIIIKIFTYFTRNIINSYILSILVVIIYRILVFLFLNLIQAIDFNLLKFLHSITNSILINMLYISIFYYLLNSISNRIKIKKIR